MILVHTFFVAAVVALIAAVYLALGLRQAGDDPARRKAVPVKPVAIGLSTGFAIAFIAGFLFSNITAINNAVNSRGEQALVSIMGEQTLLIASESLQHPKGHPFVDINVGTDVMDYEQAKADLGAGRKINLRTTSGTPATLQLISTGKGEVEPVLTYDGKREGTLGSYKDRVKNTTGYPQLLPMPALPSTPEAAGDPHTVDAQ